MTNGEKLREVFPKVIFIYQKVDDKTNAIMCTDEWLDDEYIEPITKNDLGVDCISRAEAIKCLECDFDITGKENMKTVVNYINSAHDKIVNLPRVKQEPKTGHKVSGDLLGGLYCSECMTYVNEYFNYCPNCGCRMVEPQESEDKE